MARITLKKLKVEVVDMVEVFFQYLWKSLEEQNEDNIMDRSQPQK
jgi:hypothetical protein